MAARFSDRILKVMNVSGYHAGDNILVEVDIGTPSLPSTFPWLSDPRPYSVEINGL